MAIDMDPVQLGPQGRPRKGEKGLEPHPRASNAAFRLLGANNKASDLNAPLHACTRGFEGPNSQIM